MAITISELIDKKKDIQDKRKSLYDFETSLGDFTFRVPDSKLVADAWNLTDNFEGNCFLILNCAVDPNLKAGALQKEFGCAEPIDIVTELFQAGEISRIATTLLNLAGFSADKIAHKLHNDIKNS